MIDVGQGLAVLLKLPGGEAVLYDAGPHATGPAVVRYLRDHGVRRLAAFVGSHPDADHIGGAAEVLRAVPTEAVYTPKMVHTTQTYLDFLQTLADLRLRPVDARAGVTIPVGGGAKAVFVGRVREYPSEDTNDASGVLRVSYGSVAVLLTGDAEEQAEADMMAAGEPLRAQILVVGHHGSKYSSSAAFLAAVRPAYAAISVGRDNPYGHPTPEAVGRLRAGGAAILRTDLQGTLVAVTDGKTVRWNVSPLPASTDPEAESPAAGTTGPAVAGRSGSTPANPSGASHPEWAKALQDLQATGDVDCKDFATRSAAQSFFLGHGGPRSDPYGLDADHDGLACESLR